MLAISEFFKMPGDLRNLKKREDECLKKIEKSQSALDSTLRGREEERERRRRKLNGDDREK